jgi:hypothetical protein
MNNDIESQVRTEILSQLKRVTLCNSPAINQKLQTEKGYNFIERLIIERAISTRLSIDQIIPHIEQELNDL